MHLGPWTSFSIHCILAMFMLMFSLHVTATARLSDPGRGVPLPLALRQGFSVFPALV